MENAHKSISVVTSFVYIVLYVCEEDDEYLEISDNIEKELTKQQLYNWTEEHIRCSCFFVPKRYLTVLTYRICMMVFGTRCCLCMVIPTYNSSNAVVSAVNYQPSTTRDTCTHFRSSQIPLAHANFKRRRRQSTSVLSDQQYHSTKCILVVKQSLST